MNRKIFTLLITCIAALTLVAQPPIIGGYNVYYGDLHNHSTASDGSGTPQQAYSYARYTSGLDFFSLADHTAEVDRGNFTPAAWSDIKSQANKYNQDGVFVTFYGFEWSHRTHGHVAVINTEDYCSHLLAPTNNFEGLVAWLASRPAGVAFCNHPGRQNSTNQEFLHFTSTPSRQFVGMELWNKGSPFRTYWFDPSSSTNGYNHSNNMGYFDEALSKGWRIGASGARDYHGHYTGSWGAFRMAVLANNLTRNDLLAAMRARRFYSTLDRSIALSFTVNGKEMGSILEPGTHTFRIRATNGDGKPFTRIELFRVRVGGNQRVVVWSADGIDSSSINRSVSLVTSPGDIYYVKVTGSGRNEAISSPIWITRCGEEHVALRNITSNETITSCDVVIEHVTIHNNARLRINARNSVYLERDFEVHPGSILEINMQ